MSLERQVWLALSIALAASGCCMEEGCYEELEVTATVPGDAPLLVELCFRSECDSVEVALEEEAELFTDGRAPWTLVTRWHESLRVLVEFNVERRVTGGVDGDPIRLRVLDLDGGVLLDESRAVDYEPLGCGCYRAQIDL